MTTTLERPSATLVAASGSHPHAPRESRWATPAVGALMLVAGVVYAAGIPLGLIHNYYGPAVRSMSQSWTAWLWGGWDTAVSITLDKLPFPFQIQALSARIFGWSDWSVLMPQVVEAVLTIGVLYVTVRRWLGARAGLLAALAFATTPIVAALAHSQIVDTLLVLMLSCAAYAWTRAVQSGSTRWLLAAGAFVGLAFNAKMAEAWGVLPALALAYWLFAPGTKLRRLLQVVGAGLVTLAVSLWWLIVVSFVPASSRPWIDGSQSNSIWEMVFSYNLFTRYESASVAPGRAARLGYLLGADVASQVGWFYPLALLGLVGALWWRRREHRTDLVRAAAVMSGLWLLTFGLAFSLGRVAHSFYVDALAPAVVGLAAIGLVLGWRAWRSGEGSGWALPAAIVATLAWTAWLQLQFPSFMPWVTPAVVTLGVAGLVALGLTRHGPSSLRHVAVRGAAALLGAALLLAPTTWALSTTQRGWSGSNIGPSAGPAQGMGGGGGSRPQGGQPPSGQAPADRQGPPAQSGQAPSGAQRQGAPGGSSANGTALLTWLRANDPGSTYDVAVIGYDQAGSVIEAGGRVIAVGGFTGQMPSLTAEQLQQLAASGQLHYVLIGQGGGGMGGGQRSAALASWVTQNCTQVTGAPVSGLYRCG